MRTPGFWRPLAGFGVWASALIWLYAANGIGCAFGWEAAQRPMLVAVVIAHVLALALLAARIRGTDLLGHVGICCVWAAMAATVLTFTPALALSVCV